jgi:HemY protein
MKKLIVYFVILLLAVWAGILMHAHPGYVLIGFDNVRIEISLWLAIFIILLVMWLLYWLLQLLYGAYRIPRRLRGWNKRRGEAKMRRLSERGNYALLAGNWRRAEQSLTKAAKQQSQGALNYMHAAEAAQAQKDYAGRDNYIEQARQAVSDKSQLQAIASAQVRWQLASEQWEAAKQTLTSLQAASPRHPFVLLSLKQIDYAEQNWPELQQLLPKLKQQHILPEAELIRLEHEVYLALMAEARQTNQVETLEKIWRMLPDYLRKEPSMVAAYTEYLIAEGNQQKAEALLKNRLGKTLDPQLLQQYAKVVSENSARQLARAESWLTNNPHNPALLHCLGILCIRHRLWGKARTYLSASNEYQPQADVYVALGEVQEQLGEKAAALDSYREGLKLLAK